jgi:hypothetical protein
MQGRLTQNDVSNRINVEDADLVGAAVVRLFAARYPGTDFNTLGRAFEDVKALFGGSYPGYLACDTLYHDLRHTLDAALATARLVDGHERAQPEADRLGPRRAMLAVVIALLHDIGYVRRTSESGIENGAVFTRMHVARGSDFVLGYLPSLGFGAEAPLAAKLIHYTGYEIPVDELQVADPKDHVLGCIVGTADLIAQMADRTYLEKCRDFLYEEFVWGGIARERLASGEEVVHFGSPGDVLLKTPEYYDGVARKRIERTLGGVDRYAEAHFGGGNLYRSEIETTMRFLRTVIRDDALDRIRRQCYSLSSRRAAPATPDAR